MSFLTKTTLLLQVAVFIANFFLGMLVIRRNPRSKVNVLFCVYALSLAFWNISLFFTITAIGGPAIQLWWSRLAFSFFLLMLNSFFYFTVAYPPEKKTNRIFDAIFWSFTAVIFILTLTPLLVVGDIKIIDGFITGALGPLMQYLTWYYLALIFLSLSALIFKITRHRGIERVRLRYILLGFALFAIPSVTTNVILPIFFQKFEYNNLGPLFSFPMLAVISYAIIQYRFMEIRTIIRRGTVFTLLFVALSAVIVFGTSFFNTIVSPLAAQITTAVIVALLFSPLKRFLEVLTDKVFFRRPYYFERELAELNHFIAHTYKLDDLVGHIISRLSDVFKFDRAALFLAEGADYTARSVRGDGFLPKKIPATNPIVAFLREKIEKAEDRENKVVERDSVVREQLESEDDTVRERLGVLRNEFDSFGFEIAVPIFSKKEIIGVMFLGEKKSQDPYSVQDLRFLDIVAHELSFSFENLLNIDRILKLDKAKSEFISVVSHQLRTPLSIARWNMEMMLEEGAGSAKDGTIQKGIRDSYESVMKMNEGLNNLIAAIQITEKGVKLQEKEVDLKKDIVDPVLKEFSGIEKEKQKKISVVWETSGETRFVCDPMKITFVFRSLLHNAVTYNSPEGNVSLLISAEGKNIVVTIEDDGIGIPEKNREDVFRKFWRGEEARSVSPNGLGLSLFISKAFIEAHGGALRIANKSGPGARIVFSFPVDRKKPKNGWAFD